MLHELTGGGRQFVQAADAQGQVAQDALDQRFALILGAEILYDRASFPALVDFLARHLTANGSALLADARRTNTEEFYHLLDKAGLQWTREEKKEREENLPLTVSIVTIRQ